MNANLRTWRQAWFGRWMVLGFYGVSLGLALPLAVFTCNGLLGLLVHGIALTGMASLLGEASHDSTPQDRACGRHSLPEVEAV